MSDGQSDEAFARHVNELGIATLEQLDQARALQAEHAKKGILTPLAEILVQQGVLTPAMRENVVKKLKAMQAGGLKELGNYKLLKKLGEGGMGAVYLAEDTIAQRQVALKVLPRKYAADPEFLTRFRREAKAAGKLNHVNIIGAFTVGEELGNHYYVMEYCDGEPLDSLLKKEQILPWDKAVEITMQVARGLGHAHKHGFIHRDIKPANIFITKEGVAKILDLGLSKNILDSEQSFNTQTGIAMGTPHYISPEQARGDKGVDGRTDIYSLGATLYHLVTGQTPFQGTTAAMIMMKHLSDQLPNPQDLCEDIPDAVVHVIQKMMAKEADDRYSGCLELLSDLELVIDGKAPSSHALDAMKSSIAMRGAKRGAVDDAAGRMRRRTGPQPPASRKGEPVDNRKEDRRATGRRADDQSESASFSSGKMPLRIAAGVAAVGAVLLIIAMSRGNGSGAASGEGSQQVTIPKNDPKTNSIPAPPPTPAKLTSTAFTAGQILLREDFEKFNLDNVPPQWTIYERNSASLSISNQARSGKALRVARKENAHIDAGLLSITLDATQVRGHTLRASVFGYCPQGYTPNPEKTSFRPRLGFQVAGQEDVMIALPPAQRDWHLLTITKVIPADAVSVKVFFGVQYVSAEVFFDDLLLEFDPDLKSPPQPQQNIAVRPPNVPMETQIANANLTPEELALKAIADARKWLPLFDGKSLDGFHNPGFAWRLERGGDDKAVIVNRDQKGAIELRAMPEGITGDCDFRVRFEVNNASNFEINARGGRYTAAFDRLNMMSVMGRANDMILSLRDGGVSATINGAPVMFKTAFRPSSGGVFNFYQNGTGTIRILSVEYSDPTPAIAKTDAPGRWARATSLLPSVDAQLDAVQGKWEWSETSLISPQSDIGDKCKIELPYQPPQEYDLRAELSVQPEGSGADATIILSKDGQGFGFKFWGRDDDTVTGFENIGGRNVLASTSAMRLPKQQAGKRYVLVIEVRKASLKGYVDGALVSEWKPADGELSMWPGWKLRSEDKLGVGSAGSRAVFHSVDVLDVTGKGKLLRLPAAPPINLLSLIDPAKDSPAGRWQLKDGALVSDASSFARTEIPYQPAEEFDFRIEFTAHGNPDVNQLLTRNGQTFHWMPAGASNTLSGFAMVNGQFNNETTVRKAPNLESGRRYVSHVQVRKDGLKAFIDGKLISELKTNFQNLSPLQRARMNDSAALGVLSHNCPTTFHKIEVLEITGKGKFTRPGDPAAKEAAKKQ